MPKDLDYDSEKSEEDESVSDDGPGVILRHYSDDEDNAAEEDEPDI